MLRFHPVHQPGTFDHVNTVRGLTCHNTLIMSQILMVLMLDTILPRADSKCEVNAILGWDYSIVGVRL